MSRSKNKKNNYAKIKEGFKKNRIFNKIKKIEQITAEINVIVNDAKNFHEKEKELVTRKDKLLKEIETYEKIDEQIKLLSKLFKKSNEPIYFGLILFFFSYMIFEFYFKSVNKEYITYYLDTIVLSLSILFLCKLNWKTVATLVSLFAFIKYLFIHHELSSYYTLSIHFDIYMLFLSLMVFYCVFLIELFLISIYLMVFLFSILLNSIKNLYKNEIKNNISFYIKFFTLLLSPSIPLFYWGKKACVYYLIFLVSSVTIGAAIALFVIKRNPNASDYFSLQLQENSISYKIFKILNDINVRISKIHENMNFMSNLSFLNLGKISKTLFVCVSFIWLCKSIGMFKFFDTYNYNIVFYEKNNGYCTNLNQDDLTFKTNSYDITLLLSHTIRDDAFLLKEGDFVRNKEDKISKYYIYEMKCEHNYKI